MQTRLMKELKGFLSHASITTPLKAPRLTYSGEQENQSMVRKVGTGVAVTDLELMWYWDVPCWNSGKFDDRRY